MAKIILRVELDSKKAVGDINKLKESLNTIADSINNIKPGKDLTAQIKALAGYYKTLTDAAQKATAITQKQADADAKAAINAAKVAKAQSDKVAAENKAKKSAEDLAAATSRKEAAETRAAEAADAHVAATLRRVAAAEKAAKKAEEEEKPLWKLEAAYASLYTKITNAVEKYPLLADVLGRYAKEVKDTHDALVEYNRGRSEEIEDTEVLIEKKDRLSASLASVIADTKEETEAIRSNQEEMDKWAKSIQDAETKAKNMKTQLYNMLTTISNIENRYPAGTFDQLKADIQAQISGLDNLDKKSEEYVQQVDEAGQKTGEFKGTLAQLRAETEHAAPAVATLGEKFGNLIERYAKFYASSLLVRKPLQLIQNALSDVGETLVKTEDAVIELNRVLDDPQPAQEISNRLYDMAYQYGSTFENASKIAANFARAGKSWNDSLKATEAALLAMNVAELDATQASDGLLSIIAQFDMQASDLIDVVDKLNKTADKNPVSTQKLLQAIQRAGSAAKNANVSFDQTLGLITAISEATNRSGQNIGTAINSLIQYSTKNVDVFSSLSKESADMVDKFKTGLVSIVDVWNQVAEDIHNDKEARDNIISALGTDGLEELSSTLHDELGDLVSEIDGVYNVANTYRKNYFIALLDNMDRFMTVQEQLTDYQGYSQEENEKYMETYTAKVNQLIDAWQKLANDEQGILAFKKWTVELGIAAIDLVDDMGGIVPTVVNIANAVALVTGLFKAGDFAKKILEIKANLTGMEVQTVATTTAVQGLSTAFSFLSIGVAAITGIITLVVALNRNMEEARQKTIETAKAHSENAKLLKELYDRYTELTPGTDEYKDVEEQIVEILGEKAKLLPSVTKETDKYREAINNLTEAELANYRMEQYAARDAAEKSLLSDQTFAVGAKGRFYDDALKDSGLSYLGFNKNTVDSILSYYDKLIAKQSELAVSYEELLAAGDKAAADKVYKQWQENGKQIAAVSEKVENYRNTIKDVNQTILGLTDTVTDHITGRAGVVPNLEQVLEAASGVSESIEDVSDTVEEAGAKYDKVNEGAENFAKHISQDTTALSDNAKALEIVTAAQEELAKTGTLSLDTVSKLVSLGEDWVYVLFDENGAIDLTSDALNQLINRTQEQIAQSGYLIEKTESTTDSMKDLSAQIDDVQSALATLKEAQAEYEESGSITVDTLQKLLELGDEYLDLIIDEEGQLRINEDAVNDLVESKKELLDQLIAEEIEKYASERLNYYLAKSTEEVGDTAEVAAEQIGKLALAYALARDNAEGVTQAQTALEEYLARKAYKAGAMGQGWAEDYVNDVINFANSRMALRNTVNTSLTGWKSESESKSSSSKTKEKDEELERLESIVSLRESELTLMEHQGKSEEEQIAKIREIQSGIHDVAEYLRATGASQEDINKQMSEWWKWEEKINKFAEDRAKAEKKAAEDAEKAAKEAEKLAEEQRKQAIAALNAETSRHKQVVSDLKAELNLWQKQGKSVSEQVEEIKKIQAALHDEAEWLRQLKATQDDIVVNQADIDALSAEWWDWQEKILQLYKEILEEQKKIELEAVQKTIDAILKEIDLEEEALELSEKRLAVDKARGDLEEAIAKAKIDYVESVLSEYLTALSDAETLEQKQRAVIEAREKLVSAEREAKAKAIIDAFKAEKAVKSDTLSLEEKRLAVEKARQALADAENDRTTRVYNEATGQWEFQANAKNVQSAQENLTKAIEALNAYAEEQAWQEVSEAVEKGSVSEEEVLEILEKWAKESYGNGSPEFVSRIQSAFRKAMGTAASPDSVAGQISSVDNAVKSLNDYLKSEAVKELKAYIAAGNTDTNGMREILNRWLSIGEGSELYDWRDGLIQELGIAIDSGRYDDTKVTSQVQAVENAVKGLHDYLQNRFVREITDLARNGTAEEIRAALERWGASGEIDQSRLDWGNRVADAKSNYEEVESRYDSIISGKTHTDEEKRSVMEMMRANSEAWWTASEEEKRRLADLNYMLGTSMGWHRKSDGAWYDERENRVYDKGGVLRGRGGIKATDKPEIILDPELTAKILRPGSEAQFRAFADAMHLMFERGDRTRADRPVVRPVSSVDSHNSSYTVNGIPIPASAAESQTIVELFRSLPAAR